MNTDELLEFMAGRRTVREFSRTEVDDEVLDRAISASTFPPSGADLLPFAVIKVSDEELKMKIREGAEKVEKIYHDNADDGLKHFFESKGIDHEKGFLTEAPVLLVIAGDTKKPYWRESTWLSIAYLLLGLESEGLGTVTYTPSETDFLKPLLNIPEEFSPEVILPVGYPLDKLPPKKSRVWGKVFEEKYG